jgi:hypothetical protein
VVLAVIIAALNEEVVFITVSKVLIRVAVVVGDVVALAKVVGLILRVLIRV